MHNGTNRIAQAPCWQQRLLPDAVKQAALVHLCDVLQERDAAAAAVDDEEGCVPESHPALLTVGGDAVLRFWVEVTLRPLLGSDGCGQPWTAGPLRPPAHARQTEIKLLRYAAQLMRLSIGGVEALVRPQQSAAASRATNAIVAFCCCAL